MLVLFGWCQWQMLQKIILNQIIQILNKFHGLKYTSNDSVQLVSQRNFFCRNLHQIYLKLIFFYCKYYYQQANLKSSKICNAEINKLLQISEKQKQTASTNNNIIDDNQCANKQIPQQIDSF
ncbi:hypothetical protein ABPG72_012244 [Tetrahymena utriculariae]